MASSNRQPALELIIRFTASLPDLPLTVPADPSNFTTISLKHLVRENLSPSLSSSRLRLIYAGKVLSDTAPLSLSLRLPTPPSPPSSSAQGKAPHNRSADQPIYIHCSLSESSDLLSPAELAAEAALAASTSAPLQEQAESDGPNAPSTTPVPRGFDRLLSAGFTAVEVASLRSQFLAIQTHTHTPDTMPSASELRTMEDRWIDDTGTTAAGGPIDTRPGGNDSNDEDGAGGALDDMLWGNIMGFFWPLGAVVWLLREEGVWTKRRQIAVVTGVLINIAFSILRVTG